MTTKFNLNLDHRSSTSIGQNAGSLLKTDHSNIVSPPSELGSELKDQGIKDRGKEEVEQEVQGHNGSEPYGKFYLARVLGEFPVNSSGQTLTYNISLDVGK